MNDKDQKLLWESYLCENDPNRPGPAQWGKGHAFGVRFDETGPWVNYDVKKVVDWLEEKRWPIQNLSISQLASTTEGEYIDITPQQFAKDAESVDTTLPIIAKQKSDGQYDILDGNHRFLMVKQANQDTIPAWVLTQDQLRSEELKHAIIP